MIKGNERSLGCIHIIRLQNHLEPEHIENCVNAKLNSEISNETRLLDLIIDNPFSS